MPGTFYVVPATQDTNGDGIVDAFVNPGGAFTNSLFVCNVVVADGTACPPANLVALQTGEPIRISGNNARGYQFITKEELSGKPNFHLNFLTNNKGETDRFSMLPFGDPLAEFVKNKIP